VQLLNTAYACTDFIGKSRARFALLLCIVIHACAIPSKMRAYVTAGAATAPARLAQA
jgi:hypothetical protein